MASVASPHPELKRTFSGSSTFSFQNFRQSMNKSKSKTPPVEQPDRIVIYDQLNRELWVDTKDALPKTGSYVRVPIRGKDTNVTLCMETGPKEKPIKIFIANVDLGVLGKWVKIQREKDKMQAVYVLGQTPMGFSPIPEDEAVS